MKTRLTRHVNVKAHGAVFLILGFGDDRDCLALLLRLNRDAFETLFVMRSLNRGVGHFGLVPAVYRYATVESVDSDARRSIHCKRARFFTLKALAGVVRSPDPRNIHALNARPFPDHVSLCAFDLTLRFTHRCINLALCLALRFASDAGSVHAFTRSLRHVTGFYVNVHVDSTIRVAGLQRRGRTERQSILCVSDLDAAVHISELDARATGSDLPIHAVAHVLAVFDL